MCAAAAEASLGRQIRGSALLLIGRVLSLAVALTTQLLVVRYLSKPAYGAFAYALSAVTFVQLAVQLGLDRAVVRFVPVYRERGQLPEMAGTVVLALSSAVLLGAVACVTCFVLRGWLASSVAPAPAVSVLVVLVLLAPLAAIDDIVVSLFAVLARPTAILFRTHVIAPGLRLLAVLLAIATGRGVQFLAGAYVVGAALGLLLYAALLLRLLRTERLWPPVATRRLRVPYRAVLGYALPLLSSDLVYLVATTFGIFALGYLATSSDVATFRAVQPAAALNSTVLLTFETLFTPLAAELYGRGDLPALGALYRRNVAWSAVLSLPFLALTAVYADVVTPALFGARYASSSAVLALLAVGYYAQSVYGVTELTLEVAGRVRFLVLTNALTIVLNVGLVLAAVPRFGAAGAAGATAASLAFQAGFRLLGLRRLLVGAGPGPEPRVVTVVAGVLGALLVSRLWDLGALAAVVLSALGSAAALALTKQTLRLADTFPELARLPLVRWLVR